MKNKFLFHGSHVKNLKSIQRFGLLPDYGDVIKSTEIYQTYLEDDIDSQILDDIGGMIFFSNDPNVWQFAEYGKRNYDINNAVLVIVKNNKTIFYKKDDKFFDYKGRRVKYISYYDVYELPLFIEDGDWFSFEEQEPYKILYGRELINFVNTYK